MGLDPEIPLKLEPKEEVLGEYPTRDAPQKGSCEGDDGKLVVTSQRVLFYHRHASVRKVIKRGTPQLDLISSIPLNQVQRISTGGIGTKYFAINGRKYFLEGSDMRAFNKTITALVKSTGATGSEAMDSDQEETDSMPSAK